MRKTSSKLNDAIQDFCTTQEMYLQSELEQEIENISQYSNLDFDVKIYFNIRN